MIQQVVRSVFVVAVLAVSGALLLPVAPAAAERAVEPAGPTTGGLTTIDGLPGRRVVVETPLDAYAKPTALASQTIYLERCRGGCMVIDGINDATRNSSSLPEQQVSTVNEFENRDGLSGAAADDEWAQVVQCMKEVYSPYNAVVTDVKPPSGLGYHMAMIAGRPGDINLSSNQILGVAQLTSNCSAIDNVISFTFANLHPRGDSVTERVQNICWTAAQESAHAFGLDHAFSYSGNRSACNDPMTYRNDCGGQKFFRNESASCGETAPRPCACAMTQNSHLKVTSVFGPGTPITGSPTVEIVTPGAGGALGGAVAVRAGSKRGVARVELQVNGYKWAEVAGLAFGEQGQANPGNYNITVPAQLPDSIVDIKAIAFDDLGASTESALVTATKGAACASASTCAEGQKCEAGRCFWDPPVGEFGDECTFSQFCISGICRGTEDQQICTKNCIPNEVESSCGDGFSCVMDNATSGVCFFADSGGCCSVDRSERGWLAHAGLAALVLALVMRRRRR